jgi:hypothetical protein
MTRDHLNGSHERFKPLGPASDIKPGDRIRVKHKPEWPAYTVISVKGGQVEFRMGPRQRGFAPVGGVIRASHK